MKALLICLSALLICTETFAQNKTEIVVKKGIVKTTTNRGDSLVRPGQKAVLQDGKEPAVALNNEIVKMLLSLEEEIRKERQEDKLLITHSHAQVISVDKEDYWKIGALLTVPNTELWESSTCRVGPTSILSGIECFDLQGRPLDYTVEPLGNSMGYLYFNFPAPISPGDFFRCIMISDFQPGRQLIRKLNDQWFITGANDTQNCLNYIHVILPTSAIYVKSEPEAHRILQTQDRVAVTIRNYTGPEANGRFRIFFLWPEKDGVSLKGIPWTNAGPEVVEIYELFLREDIQSPALWGELAIKLIGGRFYEEAYDAFERCCNGHESPTWDYTALTWLGHLHDLWGQREAALEKYRQALAVKPEKSNMRHDQWGMILTRRWLEERLQTPFIETMLIFPEDKVELKKRFDELPWENAGKKALDLYRYAVEKNIDEVQGWVRLGIKMVGSGYYDEAMDCFIRGETGSSTHSYLFCSLIWQGHLWDLKGQRDKAVEKYYQALAMDDDEIGQMRHDQWGIVLTKDWVRQRLETPFTLEMLK